MNYTLLIAGKEIPVEAEVRQDGSVAAAIGGRDITARYRIISEHQIIIDHDGKTVNVFLCPDHGGRIIHVDGIAYPVRDAAAITEAGRRRGRKDLPREVTPPMPSVVVRVMVAEGDVVAKGQGVIVVSAMKMETTLQAPFSGRVVKVNASEGEKVMPGMILVEIEEQEE